MGEIYLSCPHCNAELSCDEQLAGQELQCSSCQGLLIAPEAGPSPAAHPQTGGAPRKKKKKKKRRKKQSVSSGSAAKYAKISVGILVAGVALYFGYGYLQTWQESLNEKRREVEADSDGGQLGHIADLYNVLEMTEVDSSGYGAAYANRRPLDGSGAEGGAGMIGYTSSRAETVLAMPVDPPTWTLEPEEAKFAQGRACGHVAGEEFLADLCRIVPLGDTHALSIRKGADVIPDQEVLIYLPVGPDEELQGQTWEISPDMEGATVPQVMKRWRADPVSAPGQRLYRSGYNMKLELVQSDPEGVLGKIFVALPDDEHTVVSGAFYAELVSPTPTPTATQAPTPNRMVEEDF